MRFHPRRSEPVPLTAPTFRGFTILEIIILTAIIGLLAAIAVPNFLMARDRAARDLCIYNLGRIDSAKGTWALQYGGISNEEPTPADLKPFFAGETIPTCPAGGEYEIGFLHEPPFCTLENLGHLYLPFKDDAGASYGPPGGAPPPGVRSPGGKRQAKSSLALIID